MLAGDLLEGLDVIGASRDDQEGAVRIWLAGNDPNLGHLVEADSQLLRRMDGRGPRRDEKSAEREPGPGLRGHQLVLDRYALCGSVVVDAEVVADDRPVVALLTSCIACERKAHGWPSRGDRQRPLLEKSYRELREAQTLMVVANRTIEAWI